MAATSAHFWLLRCHINKHPHNNTLKSHTNRYNNQNVYEEDWIVEKSAGGWGYRCIERSIWCGEGPATTYLPILASCLIIACHNQPSIIPLYGGVNYRGKCSNNYRICLEWCVNNTNAMKDKSKPTGSVGYPSKLKSIESSKDKISTQIMYNNNLHLININNCNWFS